MDSALKFNLHFFNSRLQIAALTYKTTRNWGSGTADGTNEGSFI